MASSCCSCCCSAEVTLIVCDWSAGSSCRCRPQAQAADKRRSANRVHHILLQAGHNEDGRGGCSLGAFDRILGVVAAGQRDAHPPVLERLGLGEDAQVNRIARRAERERFGDAVVGDGFAFLGREDDRRGRRARQLDRRDRQPEDRPEVQFKLIGKLRDQGHHAGVVGARRELGEDRLVAADEELDAEDAVAA